MNYLKNFKQAFLLSLVLFALCGLAYPYALTGIGQTFMPEKANASILYMDGKAVGSALVGQNFSDPRFLKGRPSSVNYNIYTAEQKADGSFTGVASGSANFGATNPALTERIAKDKEALLASHPDLQGKDIPTDLLTASGSGLDPHISVASALAQLPALVQHTGLSREALEAIIAKHTLHKAAGIFGGEGVHVLKVNMDIARALGMKPGAAGDTAGAAK